MNGILVVSFGTSYKQARENSLDKIEREIKNYYKDFLVYKAYTSNIIIDKILKETGTKINTVNEALKLMIKDGITNLIVQPTHMIDGIENQNMINTVKKYKKYFHSIKIGSPLLSSQKDFSEIVKFLSHEFSYLKHDEHVILMGHGSSKCSNNSYHYMQNALKSNDLYNFHLITLDTSPSIVISNLKKYNIKTLYLMPLMIVAGKHALKDMTGGKYSLENILINNGFNVTCILKGLCEYKSIRSIFLSHIKYAKKLK